MSDSVSIILRAKNEEKWIGKCLSAIHKQVLSIPIEIVLVDSGSQDKTIQKAQFYGVNKVVRITRYTPGYSLNQGISNSSGKYIVLLSSHCIPIGSDWLQHLLQPLIECPAIASASYGRQVPTPSSHPNDIRDLMITFGIEDKIQKIDSFFHNANSALPRKLWERFPFDENISNIEDRLWSQEIINSGHTIYYASKAVVYHWHGIHQYGNETRSLRTASILKSRLDSYPDPNIYPLTDAPWLAFIPIDKMNNIRLSLLRNLISLLSLVPRDWIPIICSHEDPRSLINSPFCIEWINRSVIPSEDSISMHQLLGEALAIYESSASVIAEHVAIFNISYAFRDPKDLFFAIQAHETYDLDATVAEYIEGGDLDLPISTSAFEVNFKTLSAKPSDFLASIKRKISSSGVVMPGHFTLLNAPLARCLPDKPREISCHLHLVAGQEKLLKINNLEDISDLYSLLESLQST